jgi:hypothetical protein
MYCGFVMLGTLGCVLVSAGGWALGKLRPLAGVPLANRLVIFHSVVIFALMLSGPVLRNHGDPQFDGVYVWYLLVPGPHIYSVAQSVGLDLAPFTWRLPWPASCYAPVVWIPGLVGLLLGGMQWCLVGWAVSAWRGMRPDVRRGFSVQARGERHNARD